MMRGAALNAKDSGERTFDEAAVVVREQSECNASERGTLPEMLGAGRND